MNKRALVVGGRGDIGASISKKLSREFVVTTTSSDLLDLSKPENIDTYFESTLPNFDALIFCAAVNHPVSLKDCSQEMLLQALQVNALSFVMLTKKLQPYWQKVGGGKVVAIGSLYASISRISRLPYTLSKHALLGAVRNMALELASDNILINAVSPGYIQTKMTEKNNTPKMIASLCQNIPLKHLGDPDDVAGLVLYLVSNENKYVTGQNLIVDGGFMINGYGE